MMKHNGQLNHQKRQNLFVRKSLSTLIAVSMGLFACQVPTPSGNNPNSPNNPALRSAGNLSGAGSVAIQFDLGQNLSRADFKKLSGGFKVTQATQPETAAHMNKKTAEVIPGEFILKLKTPPTDTTSVSSSNTFSDVDIVKPLSLKKRTSGTADAQSAPELYHVKLKANKAGQDAAVLTKLQSDPNVAYASPNYKMEMSQTPPSPVSPNDLVTGLWGLNNTGQNSGTPDKDIDAPEAWSITQGNNTTGPIIAVIDTGGDYNHPDLSDNRYVNPGEIPNNGVDDDSNGYIDDVYGYDFVNRDGDPMDDHSHGTHVAGTIAAKGNNGIGVTGVNWNARIMHLKVLGSTGSGSMTGIIEAVRYAYNNGAKVANFSLGCSGCSSQALIDALNAANTNNMLAVAAAGNASSNNDTLPHLPANAPVPNMIAVAATDRNDNIASFSNYGKNTVHLGAPGVSTLSTTPNNGYGSKSGTSMATPHVAGVAGLLRTQFPNETIAQIKERLLKSVDLTPALTDKTVTGGRLNAYKALTYNTAPPPPPPSPSPSNAPPPPPSDNPIDLTKVAAARITVISAEVAEPAVVTITRAELEQGYSTLFNDIPVGEAAVTLELLDAANTVFFKQVKTVTVAAGKITPVDFTILTNCTTCQPGETGSLAVSVRTVTTCFGRVRLNPITAALNTPVSITMADMNGSPDNFTFDYGDNTNENSTSPNSNHSYAQAGRFPVSVTMNGGSCQNPYTAKAYVTVNP